MPNRYRSYLDEESSSRYNERLQGANSQWSTAAKVAAGVGVGLLAIGALVGTGGGQRMLAAFSRHLPGVEESTLIEQDLLKRFYDFQGIKRGLIADARRMNISRGFRDDAFIHDELINMGADSRYQHLFMRATKNPGALADELARRANAAHHDMGYSMDVMKDIISRQAKDTIEPANIATINRLATEGFVNTHKGGKGLFGFRPLTVGDVLKEGSDFKFSRDGLFIPGYGKSSPKGESFQKIMMRQVARQHKEFENAALSPGLFINKHGEIVDFRYFHNLAQKAIKGSEQFHLPFIGISPYDLLRLGDKEAERNMPGLAVISKDTPQFIYGVNQQGLKSKDIWGHPELWSRESDQIFIYGKTYDMMNPDKAIAEDLKLLRPYGREARTMAEASGYLNSRDFKGHGLFGQYDQTFLEKVQGIWSKNKNPDWEGNLLPRIQRAQGKETEALIRKLRNFVNKETLAIPDDVFSQAFGDIIQSEFGDLDITTHEGLMTALEKLASGSTQQSLQSGKNIKQLWFQYTQNPYQFMSRVTTHSNKTPDVGIVGKFLHDDEKITADNYIRKAVQNELIDRAAAGNYQSAIEKLLLTGRDTNTQGAAINLLLNHSTSSEIQTLLKPGGGNIIANAAESFMGARAPWYGYGPEGANLMRDLRDATHGEFLLARKTKKIDVRDIVRSLNTADKEAAEVAQDRLIGSISQLFAGRGNMQNWTSLTSSIYHKASRINDAFTTMGIGLKPGDIGSAGSIFGNLILKRYFPAIAGIFYAGYFGNYVMKGLTGYSGSQIIEDSKETVREGWATLRDKTGITDRAKRNRELYSGSQEIFELPFLHFFDASKSYQDVKDEAAGETPVRKGRYWMLSSTPYIGGKAEYYMPSTKRQADSDYKFTDVMYGSRDEYYKNAWLPTPTHPFAPIRHFITDPYHYEKKHYRDRPYLESGGFSELEGIPIVGPAVSDVVSGIFKPKRKMHQKELRSLAKQQVASMNQTTNNDSYVYIGAAGGTELRTDMGPAGGWTESEAPGESYGNVGPAMAVGGRSRRQSGRQIVATMNAADQNPIGQRIMLPTRFGTEPAGIDATGAVSARGAKYALYRGYYGATEMGGIYGWMMQSVTGQPVDNMKLIQNSGKMTSMTRSFWDLDLGGMGSEGSEIGRRFIPRERRYDQNMDINPIPNTMPSWVPGYDYFTNFRLGDPYVKVARGEARLPGAGYEALNNYHPEQMIVRASEVGKTPEEIKKYLLNISDGALPDYVQEAMEEGTEIHRQLQSRWRQQGILLSAEQEIFDPETKSTGHYDAIINTPNGPQVIDIKTVSNKRFKEVQKRGKPFEEHMDQLTIYERALGLQHGGIYYVTRDADSQQLFMGVDYDPHRHQKLVNKLNKIRADIQKLMKRGKVSPYELYDPLHRFEILADIAPYSSEYKYYAKYVTQKYGDLTGTTGPDRQEKIAAKKRIAEIKDRVAEEKKDYRLYEYHFKDLDLDMRTVHVTGVLENGTFTTREFGDTPIELGGISIPNGVNDKNADAAREFLNKYIHPGATIKIGYDAEGGPSKNTMGTVKAVGYAHGMNVNLKMIEAGLAKEKPNDWTNVGVNARFSKFEIAKGHAWESFAHMDTPFHTKFLHVSSPLEEYERREVYGKMNQQWTIKDQFLPTINGISGHHVLGAALSGAIVGGLIYGKTNALKLKGAKWGAVIGAALSLIRQGKDHMSSERWIPKARRKERDINEYFDVLTYMKYRGLYEYAAEKAKKQGFDMEKFYHQTEIKARITRSQRDEINKEKRHLMIRDDIRRQKALTKWKHDVPGLKEEAKEEIDKLRAEKLDATAEQKALIDQQIETKRAYYHEQEKFSAFYSKSPERAKLNKRLGYIADNKELIRAPKWAIAAMRYHEIYQGTLYGAPTNGGVSEIMGALPKKDRQFFAEFLKVKDPKERKEILEVIPHNERRFLQALWGMKQDQKPSLEQYFKTHYLPKADWEGWSENKNFDDIKIKVIKNEGLELSEFGFWKQDQQRAEENNAPAVPIDNPKYNGDLSGHIKRVLEGAGLSNVDVKLVGSAVPGNQLEINISKDRRQEVSEYVNNNLDSLL